MISKAIKDIANISENSAEFWMELDKKQQIEVIEAMNISGLRIGGLFEKIKTKTTEALVWKQANGSTENYKLKNIKIDLPYTKIILDETLKAIACAHQKGVITISYKDMEKHNLDHEIGHQLANGNKALQCAIIENYGNVFGRFHLKKQAFDGIWGEYSAEEAWATSFSSYINNNREFKKRYPEAFEAVENIISSIINLNDIISGFYSAFYILQRRSLDENIL